MQQMPLILQVTSGYSGTAPMIEIFIHPEDLASAVEIMGENHKV